MKKIATAAMTLVFLLTTGNIFSFGKQEEDTIELTAVEARGIVRLVGSDFSRSLVISGENREWIIQEDEQKKLMHLQQQAVVVVAVEYYYDRFYANGLPAGRQYYLKNIIIISAGQ
ncbi:MAG: hypothetical protein FWH41_00750 [Treponema sp.]|nr:hypothetical protein [Treponema sp.]